MMSKVFKSLALLVVVMLMMSVAVLAAPITSFDSAPVVDKTAGTVTVNATIADNATATPSPLASKQVTMLASKNGETPSDTNIIGIDQTTSDTSGKAQFVFGIDGTTPTGTYQLKVGGEDVNTAATTTFDIAAPVTTVTVKGIVGPFGSVGDATEDAKIAITVQLKDADGNVKATTTADTATGAYQFDNVNSGTYTVDFTRTGALKKNSLAVDTANAANGVVELASAQLYNYDTNQDGYVDGADCSALISYFDTYPGDGIYDPIYDINMDGYVDGADFAAIIPYFDYYDNID